MEAYSAIEHLAVSISPSRYRDITFAMFAVYFDDSGTHTESDVAVAACYVGDCEQWKRFEDDWERARKSEGFDVFGMADILGGKKEYRGWPQEKRDHLIRKLITISRIRSRYAMAASVIKKDYDAIIRDDLRGRMGKFHYSFAVRSCMIFLKNWRYQYGITGPIQYVFDRMAQGKGEIEAILDDVIAKGHGEKFGLEAGGYSFQNKVALFPLQAADILAHETYRCTLNEVVSKNSVPEHYMGELAKGPMTRKYWSVERLNQVRDDNYRKFEELGYWGPPFTNAKGPKLKESEELNE